MKKENPYSVLHAYFFVATGIVFLGIYLPTDYLDSPIKLGPGIIFATLASVAGLLLLLQKKYNLRNRSLNKYYHVLVYLILIVLTIRTFVVEPTRISSNSMLPSLQIGDYVFIKRFSFGLSLPFTATKLFAGGHPTRGEVLVYNNPMYNNAYFIKRLIGLPGDRITYNNNILQINDVQVNTKTDGVFEYRDKSNNTVRIERAIEYLGNSPYKILDGSSTLHAVDSVWTVPNGHYFFLGDNRDDSNDSRFMGYVPLRNLVGRPLL